MSVYLLAKFGVSSIILTSFSQKPTKIRARLHRNLANEEKNDNQKKVAT